MQIKKAGVQGFCFGVAITVKKAEEAIAARDDVTTQHGFGIFNV